MILAEQKKEMEAHAKGMRESFGKMPQTICLIRDGEVIAEGLHYGEKEEYLAAVDFLVYGMGADEVVLIMDSYISTRPDNPMTDEPWGNGEMAYMAENYPESLEKGWVSDALQVIGVSRGGETAALTIPYVKKDGSYEYGKNDWFISDVGDEVSGTIFEALSKIMKRHSVLDVVREARTQAENDDSEIAKKALVEMNTMPPWLVGCVRDLATVAAVTEKKMLAALGLFAEPGSEREQYLSHRVKNSDLNGYSVTEFEPDKK